MPQGPEEGTGRPPARPTRPPPEERARTTGGAGRTRGATGAMGERGGAASRGAPLGVPGRTGAPAPRIHLGPRSSLSAGA